MAKKFTTTIRLEFDLVEKLKSIAEKEKRSLNMQIEFSLEYFVKEYEKHHNKIK